jgi:hypothetical protein
MLCRMASDSARHDDKPYPSLADPTVGPTLAITCLMRLYRIPLRVANRYFGLDAILADTMECRIRPSRIRHRIHTWPPSCRMRCYEIRSRFMCGGFQTGRDAVRVATGPYATLAEPTPHPHLAVMCRVRHYRVRFQIICGLIRIGCDSGRSDLGRYPILLESTPDPYLSSYMSDTTG